MCGIVGYKGNQNSIPVLLNGLKSLEYRGYDSAGLAYINGGKIIIKKAIGRVKNLENLVTSDDFGNIGIAHTRWATHGKPCKENSHPHMDNSETFAVVHNGIIENYNELRQFLGSKGYTFLSQTDTEVIPNLIHYYYHNGNHINEDKFLSAVKAAVDDLKGSYAIEVISPLFPDRVIAIRKDSPLVIGKGHGENYIASDIPAILSYTKDFYFLNDFDIAYLSKNDVKFYNTDLQEIKKETKSIEWDSHGAEKGGYEHFMLKEIYEQPKAIRETIGTRLNSSKVSFDELMFTKEYLSGINKIYIVACGTAMHAGIVSKNLFEKLCKIPTEVDIASEFRYRDPLVDDKTLTIYISQSGETADTIAALKLAKEKGAKTIAVTNVIGSSITREADYSIYTHAGPEIAVASTKAYTSQVTILTLIAIYCAEVLEKADKSKIETLKQDLLKLPTKVDEVLKNASAVKKIAHKIYKEKDMFFLGRGVDYAVSLEGSLKLKEISYIHSEGYASGELKHGPIALIDTGVTVVATMTDKALLEKSISNVQEVITRGAKIIVITNQDVENKGFETVIKIPEICTEISPILSIIPLQLLAYYISKEKGLDVDKPRNLAKSVTVE